MISSKKSPCVPRLDISLEQEADVVLDDLMLPAWNRRLDHSKDADNILAIASSTEFEFRHNIRVALSLFSYPRGIIGDRTTCASWLGGGRRKVQTRICWPVLVVYYLRFVRTSDALSTRGNSNLESMAAQRACIILHDEARI